jgi:hypothetical protein
MALQIRRGTDAERTAGGGVVFANGELVYVTDTDKLFIGDGATPGGMPLAGSAIATLGEYITADTINSTLDLQQNLDLNGKDIIGTGNINIAGTINATGNVNIGDDVNTDTVDFAAKITSSLTPNADATYDLGTTLLKWNNIHAVRLDGDVEGSVFGDDSTLLVDGVSNKIVGAVDTASLRTSESKIALGEEAGNDTQGSNAIAIGYKTGRLQQSAAAVAVGDQAGNLYQGAGSVAVGQTAGKTSQGASAIAIGSAAGQVNQGQAAIAIGEYAGQSDQAANSIIINASGNSVTDGPTGSLVIKPIRDAVGTTVVMYDNSTNEVTHTASPAFDLTGNLKGDVVATNGTIILQNGSDGTDATFTGAVVGVVDGVLGGNTPYAITGTTIVANTGFTGNLTGNVVGNLTGDLTGSVFADNSTLLVDAVAGSIPGANITGTLTNNLTGNATGDHSGTFTGNVFTTLIDSDDSSPITVTPRMDFSSDVIVNNSIRLTTTGFPGSETVIIDNTGTVNCARLETQSIAHIGGGEINFSNRVGFDKDATFAGQSTFIDKVSVQTITGVVEGKFAVETFTGDPDDDASVADLANYNKHFEATIEKATFGVPAQFANMTTGVRNALTPAAGMVVFNTTETKLQVYTGSAWADLH